MKKSIFLRIFGGYLLITLFLSSLILFFTFRTIRRYYIDNLINDLKNIGLTLQLGVAQLVENGKYQELDALVKKTGNKINTRITIINERGIVLADSEKDPGSMENHKKRPEILKALDGKTGVSMRFSTTVKEKMLYVAVPIKKDGTALGVLRTSLFLKDINSLLGNLKMNIFNIALAAIVISLLGAMIFSRSLSNPIREMIRATHRVASGDFDVKITLKNKDELNRLADNFNYMTHKIKTLFSDLSSRKEELKGIISSIQEGLLVIDKDGKIILGNENSGNIFGNDSIEGRFHWEVLRNTALEELIKNTAGEKRSFKSEIPFNDKTFLCSSAFIPVKQHILLIMYDITEMKNLEKLKKDFVVNVSHELRTPLTAVKGFVETLEEELEGKHRHYLNIIRRHTDRLINIVGDLLLLSTLEDNKFKLELNTVDLKELLEDVSKIFEYKLKEKRLKLTLSVDEKPALIRADSFKLEQVFINLIDNAVKYTEKGEIKISVKRDEEHAKIEIEDTGIGIPEQHLSRIFERFYVADKSRSRSLGGTGLGLSIVKHIVFLHNGEITAESAPGKGTKFNIILPVSLS